MCVWTKKQKKAQDYFAEIVSLTQDGKRRYRSFCGGLVSIITCTAIFVYGLMQLHEIYYHPVYNSYPATVDYDYDKTVKWDLS